MVDIWQSIFKNYTYASNHAICSNGQSEGFGLVDYPSGIIFDKIYLFRFLHLPMQMLNPVDGSYRFVVCGIRGIERMAFGELINVYDKYIWGIMSVVIVCAALVWKCLVQRSINPGCKDWTICISGFLGSSYSLGKILLEQGELSSGSTSISNQKSRIFIGIFLMMCIILSNG